MKSTAQTSSQRSQTRKESLANPRGGEIYQSGFQERVECLKDSNVIEFNAEKLTNIHSLFPDFEAFQRKNLERHVVSLQKRILNQLQLTAPERYDLFLEQYPDIEQYTPNYHIASYLGITPVALSRIRKQLEQN